MRSLAADVAWDGNARLLEIPELLQAEPETEPADVAEPEAEVAAR